MKSYRIMRDESIWFINKINLINLRIFCICNKLIHIDIYLIKRKKKKDDSEKWKKSDYWRLQILIENLKDSLKFINQ